MTRDLQAFIRWLEATINRFPPGTVPRERAAILKNQILVVDAEGVEYLLTITQPSRSRLK